MILPSFGWLVGWSAAFFYLSIFSIHFLLFSPPQKRNKREVKEEKKRKKEEANILPKTIKMLTVLCISYDSEATRPPRLTSRDMKMMTGLCISYDSLTLGLDQILLETVCVQNRCCAMGCAVGCAGVVRVFLVTWGVVGKYKCRQIHICSTHVVKYIQIQANTSKPNKYEQISSNI